MTGDPERLLSPSRQADPLERELLYSVRDASPPAGAKEKVWRGVAAQLAVVAAVGTATGSSAAAASKASASGLVSWGIATKLAVAAGVSGLALAGGHAVLSRAASEGAPSASSRSHAVTPTSSVPGVAKLPLESPPQTSATIPVAPGSAPVAAPAFGSRRTQPSRLDLLREESSLLATARAQLRGGNLAGAQASLERLQSQFPQGMLGQEREVLAIEVLAARGNAEGAKRRAGAFVKAYPHSPHSTKLARFLE